MAPAHALAALTGLSVVLTLAMSLIRDDYRLPVVGLVAAGRAAACSDLATVPVQRHAAAALHAADVGPDLRIRLGAGYFGSVVLLLIVYSASFWNGEPAGCWAFRPTTASMSAPRWC